jgi:Ca-activated chloride channel family protein
MLSFSTPWALLLLLPWMVAGWRIWRTARTKGILFASAQTRFAQMKPSWRQRLCRVLPALFLVGLLLLIVGAAGPRTLLSREVRSADALAVMMAVDISGSMRALDLSEGRDDLTRLDVVKRVFGDFVEQRPEDLIGLVSFGGYASVRSPLTADHRALLHTLEGVVIPGEKGAVDERGRPVTQDELMTAIGDGLAVSLMRVKDAEPKTKIIILLSDGESNAGAVTPMLDAGMTPEDILGAVCGDLGVVFLETTEVSYKCYCTRERVTAALLSLGREELTQIMEEGQTFPVECQFCDVQYKFTPEDIRQMLQQATAEEA